MLWASAPPSKWSGCCAREWSQRLFGVAAVLTRTHWHWNTTPWARAGWDWMGLDVYTFHLPVLLSWVLTKEVQQPCRVTVIAPQPSRWTVRLPLLQNSLSQTETDYMATEPRNVLPSLMETVRKSLQSRGFCQRIVRLIYKVKHHSTESVYYCHWRVWVHWVNEQDFDPLSPTVYGLAEYVLALVQERNLKINSHLAVIFTTLSVDAGIFFFNLVLHVLWKFYRLLLRGLPKCFNHT